MSADFDDSLWEEWCASRPRATGAGHHEGQVDGCSDGEVRRRGPAPSERWQAILEETGSILGAAAGRLPAQEVEDVLQEVCLRFARTPPAPPGQTAPEQLGHWVRRVTRNLVADVIRRRCRPPTRQLEELAAKLIDHRGEDSVDAEENQRRLELLRGWLAELREEDPVNYLLLFGQYIEWRRLADLGRATGLSAHADSCRNRRSLRKLRKWASEG